MSKAFPDRPVQPDHFDVPMADPGDGRGPPQAAPAQATSGPVDYGHLTYEALIAELETANLGASRDLALKSSG